MLAKYSDDEAARWRAWNPPPTGSGSFREVAGGGHHRGGLLGAVDHRHDDAVRAGVEGPFDVAVGVDGGPGPAARSRRRRWPRMERRGLPVGGAVLEVRPVSQRKPELARKRAANGLASVSQLPTCGSPRRKASLTVLVLMGSILLSPEQSQPTSREGRRVRNSRTRRRSAAPSRRPASPAGSARKLRIRPRTPGPGTWRTSPSPDVPQPDGEGALVEERIDLPLHDRPHQALLALDARQTFSAPGAPEVTADLGLEIGPILGVGDEVPEEIARISPPP